MAVARQLRLLAPREPSTPSSQNSDVQAYSGLLARGVCAAVRLSRYTNLTVPRTIKIAYHTDNRFKRLLHLPLFFPFDPGIDSSPAVHFKKNGNGK